MFRNPTAAFLSTSTLLSLFACDRTHEPSTTPSVAPSAPAPSAAPSLTSAAAPPAASAMGAGDAGAGGDGVWIPPDAVVAHLKVFGRAQSVSEASQRDAIERVVTRNFGRFGACDPSGAPNAVGKAELTFTILPTGRVSGAAVTRSTFASAAVGSCVEDEIRKLQFARSGGAAITVRYALWFGTDE